jgi:hypothetical protein
MLKLWNTLLLLLLLVLSRSLQSQQRLATAYVSNSSGYVGDQACLPCHQPETSTYFETAHHLTSRMPDQNSILGKFSDGANILRTSSPTIYYQMTANKDGYFESAVEEVTPFQKVSHTERIDIVFGSGRRGQTYLFWRGDQLLELPVSYWTELDDWINSPGFPDGSPRFDKPVLPRCLECHSGRFEALPQSENSYDPGSLVLGITCEKCHGPGREHVLFRGSKTAASSGMRDPIVNPALLPRDRQIDICALCHAGPGKPLAPALSFTSGAALEDYVHIPYRPDAAIDVHGNQTQLLARSRCFQGSTMTCTTCHDVHRRQRDAAAFSPHCLSCHKAKDCTKFRKLGRAIASNCVDCHMPLQESEVVISQTSGRKLKPRVRNHQIGVYPEAQLNEPRGFSMP